MLMPAARGSAANSTSSGCNVGSAATLIKLVSASGTCIKPAWQPTAPSSSSFWQKTTRSPRLKPRTPLAKAATFPTAVCPRTRWGAMASVACPPMKLLRSISAKLATDMHTSASPAPISELTAIVCVFTRRGPTCTTARVVCGIDPSSNTSKTSESGLFVKLSIVSAMRAAFSAAADAEATDAACARSNSRMCSASCSRAAAAAAVDMNCAISPPTFLRLCISRATVWLILAHGRRTSNEKVLFEGGISTGIGVASVTATPFTSTITSST
mmetsp:Transcript_11313/g.18922  ORF Transcript_11313/g.18922 Transcript_11313/m.18922 type:complete len:270 (-) Transcript_11313:1291-2100(-)